MRKHFLILMLLTLLPLAGWADDPVDLSAGWQIKFDSAANYAEYTGQNVMPAVTLFDGTNTINATKFNVEWRNEADEIVTSFTEHGRYYVTVTEKQPQTFGELATPTKMFTVLIAENGLAAQGAPALIDYEAQQNSLPYSANGYQLLKTSATLKFGEALYKVVTDDDTAPGADASGWVTADNLAKVAKVGTHYVYYRADADTENGNYLALAPTLIGNVVIAGTDLEAGANNDYVAPTAIDANGIPFTNAPQNLIATEGVIKSDKVVRFEYKVDNGKWSTSVPKATDVKYDNNVVTTYTVYWKAVAVEGYNDATGQLTAKINAVAPVISAAAQKVTNTLTYSADPQELLKAAATVDLGATVTYTIGYKANAQVADFDYTGSGEYTAIADVKATNAGLYQVKAQVKAGGNYLASNEITSATIEIKKAKLTVTTTAANKVFGTADPAAFGITYAGWMKNEREAATTAYTQAAGFVAPTVTRAEGQNVGEYTISAANGSADNYEFDYEHSTFNKFTITKKTLNADDFTFTLATDDAQNPTVFKYDGTAKNNTVTAANFTAYNPESAQQAPGLAMTSPVDFVYSCANNINAGDAAQVIITGQGNYQGSIVKNFSIGKADIYVIPQNAEKAHGVADPTFTWILKDATNNTVDNAVLGNTPVLQRQAGESAAMYKIYFHSYTPAATDNYAVKNDADDMNTEGRYAWLTITAATAPLKLKFTAAAIAAGKNTKIYGENNPAWGIDDLEPVETDNGLVDGDTWATVKPTLSTPVFALASQQVNAENNQVTVTGLSCTNYPSVTVEPLAFTVEARPIAVTVVAQNRTYGQDLLQGVAQWDVVDALSYNNDALVFNDTKENLNVQLKTIAEPASYAPGATHQKVIKAVIDNDNYVLNDACVWGNLTIAPETAFILSDADTDLDTKLESVDGDNYAVKFGDMPIEAQKWYAMVLPFDTTPEELVNKLGTFLIVNRLSSATIDETTKEVTVKFGLEWNTIEAGVPFLIKTAKATNWNKTVTVANNAFSAREITATIAGETKGKASFLGTYADDKSLRWGYDLDGVAEPGFVYDGANTDWTTTTLKYRYLDVNDQKWYNQKNSAQALKPMEAYLKLDAEAMKARVLVEDFENGTTAIKSLTTDDIEGLKTSEGWYTIDGIRLQSAPTEKGIYINNGKKVVVK